MTMGEAERRDAQSKERGRGGIKERAKERRRDGRMHE